MAGQAGLKIYFIIFLRAALINSNLFYGIHLKMSLGISTVSSALSALMCLHHLKHLKRERKMFPKCPFLSDNQITSQRLCRVNRTDDFLAAYRFKQVLK